MIEAKDKADRKLQIMRCAIGGAELCMTRYDPESREANGLHFAFSELEEAIEDLLNEIKTCKKLS